MELLLAQGALFNFATCPLMHLDVSPSRFATLLTEIHDFAKENMRGCNIARLLIRFELTKLLSFDALSLAARD